MTKKKHLTRVKLWFGVAHQAKRIGPGIGTICFPAGGSRRINSSGVIQVAHCIRCKVSCNKIYYPAASNFKQRVGWPRNKTQDTQKRRTGWSDVQMVAKVFVQARRESLSDAIGSPEICLQLTQRFLLYAGSLFLSSSVFLSILSNISTRRVSAARLE